MSLTPSTLQSVLGSKIVSFHAVFAKAFDSVVVAVMLSQGLFWQENAKHKTLVNIGGKDFFSKTADEWYEETGVTEDQQRTARAKMCKCGVLVEMRAGLPARMHYRVDLEALVAVISRYLSGESPVAGDRRKQLREFPATGSRNNRGQYAGKTGNNIYEESLESFREFDGEEEIDNKADSEVAIFMAGEKEKKGRTGPARPQNFISGRVDTDAEIEEMKNDFRIRDAFSVSRKVPAAKFDDYLELFRLEIGAREKTYTKRSDLRDHFLSFAARKFKIESTNKKTADEQFTDSLRTAYESIDSKQFEY